MSSRWQQKRFLISFSCYFNLSTFFFQNITNLYFTTVNIFLVETLVRNIEKLYLRRDASLNNSYSRYVPCQTCGRWHADSESEWEGAWVREREIERRHDAPTMASVACSRGSVQWHNAPRCQSDVNCQPAVSRSGRPKRIGTVRRADVT